MTDDWMRPVTKPLPGPVESEERQMSTDEREQLVLAAKRSWRAEERAQIVAIAEPRTLRAANGNRLAPEGDSDQDIYKPEIGRPHA